MNNISKALLVVMAKEPVAGRVKTRLSPPLSPTEAAGLYRCLLEDRLMEMKALEGIDLALAYTPEYTEKSFSTLVPKNFKLFYQYGENLGDKLINIFRDNLAKGYEAVSVIDSDTPDLTRFIMLKSFDVLFSCHADVVFGPCIDGGYYLVGMKNNHPEIFKNIPWSRRNVLSVSLQKAEQLGLSVGLLPQHNDIDTHEDLFRFYRRYQDRALEYDWAGSKTFRFLSNLNKTKPSLFDRQ